MTFARSTISAPIIHCRQHEAAAQWHAEREAATAAKRREVTSKAENTNA
jgi:hypothetical protein